MPNIKETTGISPLTIVTDGSELLDWRITGTNGKIGKRSKNYLRQTTAPIPNGAVGTFIEANTDGWFNGSQNIANGYSFNTKSAKRIVLVFAKSDETALSVSDVGNLMLVKGTTIPDTYDADTNLYNKGIMWGGLYPHTYKPYPRTYSEDDAQELYAGDNGYGGEVLYRIARSFWETRCKTYSITVAPNANYSVRLFGSSATLMTYIYLLDEPGTVQQTFMGADMQGGGACAIPSCGEYNTDTEQWCRLDCIMAERYPGTGDVAVDVRPNKYEFCESFAELEAGTYKLMVEVLGNHTWNGPYVGFTSYGGNIYDSFTPSDTYPPVGTYERFAVIAEDNTLIIPETNILDSTTVRYSTSPPYPNFHHKEYTFTLTKKTKVGVIHRGYSNVWNYQGGDGDIQAYFRFMICDADVEAEEFESTNLYANISGESAWEPYRITLSLIVSDTDGGEERYDFYLDDYLSAGQSISLQDTGTIISTGYGRNTFDCDSEIKPELYLKYYAGEEINVWAAERPEQVNIYDLHEPQNGFEHNGIAVLMPSELVSDKEVLGRWDISLVHPIDEYGKWTYIAGQNIIKVKGQLFRIDETEISMDSNSEYISAHANHITYDMSDYFIEEGSYEASDGADYVAKLNNSRIKDFPNQQHVIGEYIFDIRSDLDGPLKAEVKDQSMIEALFGADDSLAVRYGGKLYRDNFHLSIYKAQERAPSGYAFAIRYRKELTKISFKIDFSSWVTNLICEDNFGSMYAVWYDTSGDWIVHHHKTKKVHFTYAELGDPDSAMDRLIADGTNYWNSVNTPVISIVVEVANIKNNPAYKDFLNLQNYDVGYKGTVYVEHLGIDVEMQIVGIRRNELTGEVLNISLGNTRNSLIRQTVLSQTVSSGSTIADKQAAAVAEVQKEINLLVMRTWGGLKKFKWSNAKKYTWKELKNGYKDS